MLRMVVGSTALLNPYRNRSVSATAEHELVNEEIIVPVVDRSSDDSHLEYKVGIISDVYSGSEDRPVFLTVTVEPEQTVRVKLAHVSGDVEN